MPRSKTGRKRVPINADAMKKAVESINAPRDKRISIREVYKVFNVKFTKRKEVKLLKFERESESEDVIIDDDGEADLLEIINNELQEELEFNRPNFQNGDYIPVGFNKKKGPTKHYGKIISKDVCGFEYQVKFYKRIGLSSKFTIDNEDAFDVNEKDILVKLPKPTESSNSARINGQLWFKVNSTKINVK